MVVVDKSGMFLIFFLQGYEVGRSLYEAYCTAVLVA